MSQALTEGVYGALTADQSAGTFYDDLSGRIYELAAPEDAALPHAVFNLVTDPPDETFSGDDIEATVQIDLYGERRLGAAALGDIQAKLLAELQGAAVTVAGFIGGVFMFTERGQRSIDGGAHRITLEALIQANA